MAKVQERLNKEIKRLDFLYNALSSGKNDLESLLKDGNQINILEINGYQHYISRLKNKITNQHKIISDTEVELEEKKQAVIEANKAKTMLEKHKENKLKEFITNIERLEFVEIDEIATNRHKKI